MKRHFQGILMSLLISISAFAAEPVIIIADLERGLALVPEGTVLPRGIMVRVERQSQMAQPSVVAERIAETDAAPATKPLDVSQSGATSFDASTGCWFGTSGGSCSPGERAVATTDPNYSATVDSDVIINRYRQSPCGIWGEPPCQEYFSSRITVSFP